MGFAADIIKATKKKGIFNSSKNIVGYSTSLLPLDFANSIKIRVRDDKTGEIEEKIVSGVIAGTHVIIIGNTGSLKTTLAQTIAGAIVKPFEDSMLIHIDAEKTAIFDRLCTLTGFDPDDERIFLIKDRTKIEDVMEMMNEVIKLKEEGGDRYMYTVENGSIDGRPFKMYVPTVFIIDSIYNFTSTNAKDTEMEGQMVGGRSARDIAQFYQKTTDLMYRYNIICISINHIQDDIQINPYAPKKKQMMLIRDGERVPRGNTPLYLAQNVFRNTYNASSRYKAEDVGFKGGLVKIEIAKTKTTDVGAVVEVAFNGKIGFDPIYSLYEYANSIGIIEGRNPSLRFAGLDQYKFSRKYFRKKFIEEPDFRQAVYATITPYLEAMAGAKEEGLEEYEGSDKKININELIDQDVKTEATIEELGK